LPPNHDHTKIDDMIEKTDDIYPKKVEIENFWDDNIKIKNKRFSNEDFKRY